MASEIFDCLIDEGEEPKKGMEYIYNLGMAWPIYKNDDDRPGSINNIFDENPKKQDLFVYSQEELDSLDYKPYSISVEEDIIVTDVVSIKHPTEGYHRGYKFTIKESGIRCRCNYPWAFWENSPANLAKIKKYKDEKMKLDKQENFVEKLRGNIDQLSIE